MRTPPLPPDRTRSRSLAYLLVLGGAAVGCREPLGVDRHDLVGFRVGAIAADLSEGGDTLTLRTATVVDGHPWADEPVRFQWRWVSTDDVDEVAQLTPGDDFDAEGPSPVLPLPGAPARLALLATSYTGETERAVLDLDPAAVNDRAEGLSIRVTPDGSVPPGGAATLTAELTHEVPSTPWMRWMTIGGAGTFTEQERAVARWDAAELEWDDDELISRTDLESGPVSILALALDRHGFNDFTALELHVGTRGPGMFTRGRWMPSDHEITAPWVAATLVPDDASPTGLALDQVENTPPPGIDDPWMTSSLPCTEPVSGPFDPTWLFTGRCTREQVVGHRVLLVGSP